MKLIVYLLEWFLKEETAQIAIIITRMEEYYRESSKASFIIYECCSSFN
jgi:hypothetical protein